MEAGQHAGRRAGSRESPLQQSTARLSTLLQYSWPGSGRGKERDSTSPASRGQPACFMALPSGTPSRLAHASATGPARSPVATVSG